MTQERRGTTLTGSLRFRPRTLQYIARRYRNSAIAIKELVANAWDADATRVDIHLPLYFEGQPILVIDNGHGMTARELRSIYLPLGPGRPIRDVTAKLGRKFKGRLGFGKLAGFLFATKMTVRTVSRGMASYLVLDEDDVNAIDSSGKDIESLKIPIKVEPSDAASGTTIELSQLRPNLAQPDLRLVRSVLLREFGLPSDFQIFIDGDLLTADDIPGEKVERQLELPDGTTAQAIIRFLPTPGAIAGAGIAVRVDGRVLDQGPDFGLRDNLSIPRDILRRVAIEVNDDGLSQDVTSDWGGIIEDSERLKILEKVVSETVTQEIQRKIESEALETPQQLVGMYAQQLELLPYSERDRARRALYTVFSRIFPEIPELRVRRDTIANLVIDMFKEDRYFLVARRLKDIDVKDLITLSEVLSDWGLGNLAEIASRTKARLEFISVFTKLVLSPGTGEFKGVHPVLKNNPWLFGDEYELMFSNRQVDTIVKSVFGTPYQGKGNKDRPDLVLEGPNNRILIAELKSPQDTLDWDNESQLKKYVDRLSPWLPGKTIVAFVLAGKAPPDMKRNLTPGIKSLTYAELSSDAEARLQWLIKNMDLSASQVLPAQPDLGI